LGSEQSEDICGDKTLIELQVNQIAATHLHAGVEVRLWALLLFVGVVGLVKQTLLMVVLVPPQPLGIDGNKVAERIVTPHGGVELRMLGYHVVLQSCRLDRVIAAGLVEALILSLVGLLVSLLVLRHHAGIGGSEVALSMRTCQRFGALVGQMLT
jgi:hypothetical protein